MKFRRLCAIHLILIGLFNIIIANTVQAQKAAGSLPIDTFYFNFVKSSHFKIKLPQIKNLKSHEDLFNTYGKVSTVKIKGKPKQFLGDFKNINRANYVNSALNKAGINNTKITLFEVWVPPVIKKKPPKVDAKTATTAEADIKSKFKRKVKQKLAASSKNKQDSTNPFPARPKNANDNTKVKIAKVANAVSRKPEEVSNNTSPSEKETPNRGMADNNTAGEKKVKSKTDDAKIVAKIKEKEAGKFILILPKVTNPEIYQFVLKDLGTVDYKKLPNEQWYYYLGFFMNQNAAKAILPKIKERGFSASAKIASVNNAEKIALTMYKNLPPIAPPKPASNKKNSTKQIDRTLFYRIELPLVDNPEIYFKAFEDLGAGHSEISPNGKGIYYIGEFQTAETAKAKMEALKQRGLKNGTVVKFENDKRVDTYSEIYTKKEVEKAVEDIVEKELPIEPLVKTHPNGNFQIRLKQVENPGVLKNVFEDVGKLKVGYLTDDTEYYFIGNYLFQKDAEKVITQLKERGLTKFDLLNVMAGDDTPNTQENKTSTYKIKLGTLKNEQLHLFEPFGVVSSIKKNNKTQYYLGNYPTQKVAKMIIEELKALKQKIAYEVQFFSE